MDHTELQATLLRVENVAAFAKKSGVSLVTLMRWRHGRVTPSPAAAQLVAAMLRRHKPKLKPAPEPPPE